MCRELKMSDLFYNALELLGLQEYSRFCVHVSRGRRFRVRNALKFHSEVRQHPDRTVTEPHPAPFKQGSGTADGHG